MSGVKFTYFNVRARGELPRLILHAAGVKFEDKRIEFADWPSVKPSTPFGQLPMLEIDGDKWAESMSIARFLADKYSMAGKTSIDRLKADIVAEQALSLRTDTYKFHFEKDEAKKAELKKTFLTETVPKVLGHWEKFLGYSTSGFLLGSALTWAELAMLDILDYILQDATFKAKFSADFPKVAKHHEKISSLPNIKKYRDTRPKNEI